MNLYITGLNQITDVEIDKVNKPGLPIPSGILSIRDASCVVAVALATSLWIGAAHPVFGSQGLNLALYGSGILGTIYSLPPFRLKRFPLLAALCIVAVRGTIINAGFFAHAKRAAFGSQIGSVLHYLFSDRACFLSSLFFGIFGIVVRPLFSDSLLL
jgi:homogentisate phytyltransferase/homogentisate geranylgeranyltransferase